MYNESGNTYSGNFIFDSYGYSFNMSCISASIWSGTVVQAKSDAPVSYAFSRKVGADAVLKKLGSGKGVKLGTVTLSASSNTVSGTFNATKGRTADNFYLIANYSYPVVANAANETWPHGTINTVPPTFSYNASTGVMSITAQASVYSEKGSVYREGNLSVTVDIYEIQ